MVRHCTRYCLIIFLINVLGICYAQTSSGNYTKISSGTNLPTTCSIGGTFYLSNGAVGLYSCTTNNTWKQVTNIAGPAKIQSLNDGGRIFVDQYVSWSLALSACPTDGCILDATSPNVSKAIGTFDPGTKAVWILFGPYTYTADHLVLRSGMHLIGFGAQTGTTIAGTIIQSVGINSQPLLVLPQANDTSVTDVLIQGIHFMGLTGNTSQEGLFADCSGFTNAGLWYSNFYNLYFTGFMGHILHFKGRPNDALSVNQFLTFQNVIATRPSSGGNALRIEGGNGQFNFLNSQTDGQSSDSPGENIYIGQSGTGQTQVPYSIWFDGQTIQHGNLGVNISGAASITFLHAHAEDLKGFMTVNRLTNGARNDKIVVENSSFNGNVGVNAGNGFIIKSNTNYATITLKDNSYYFGTPDKWVIGTNLNVIDVENNWSATSTDFPSSGITTEIQPAATIAIGNYKSILLDASATSITTLQSTMGPGEIVTFISLGQAQFASGGNISLSNYSSPLVLSSGDTATFIRSDLWTPAWRLMATSVAKTTVPTTLPLSWWAENVTSFTGTFIMNQTTPSVPITIDQFDVFLQVTGVGCTTTGQMTINDITSGTTISTITIANGTQYFSNTAINTALTSGHILGIRITRAAAGCSTPPQHPSATVWYHTT